MINFVNRFIVEISFDNDEDMRIVEEHTFENFQHMKHYLKYLGFDTKNLEEKIANTIDYKLNKDNYSEEYDISLNKPLSRSYKLYAMITIDI